MNTKQVMEACVTWGGLVPVLAVLSLAITGASWAMVQAHAENTHPGHVTRYEYDQFSRVLWERLDRIENKIDRLEAIR